MTDKPKKIINSITLLALCVINAGCNSEKQETIQLEQHVTLLVSNPSDFSRNDISIELDDSLLLDQNSNINIAAYTLGHDSQEIPSQTLDSNNDGITDHLVFNTTLAPLQEKAFTLTYQPASTSSQKYLKRTHAELAVNKTGKLIDKKYQGGSFTPVDFQQLPKDHIIGDQLFKYEGPGWESDKIAYRLYFDKRNVIDIFGKKTPEMVLPQVGQPGGNYHKDAPWGLDILKVGDSLGIGSIGMFINGKVHRVNNAKDATVAIIDDGPLQSHIRIKHQGWQLNQKNYDLTSNLIINAGSRLTQNIIAITGKPENLVTGIVKHQPATLIHSPKDKGEWAYMATFGKQSYVNDELGMVIFYKKSSLVTLTEDQHSHLVIMKPRHSKEVVMKPQLSTLDYYFAATWAQDSDAITTLDSFTAYLEHELNKLNQPVEITLNKGK